MPHALDIFISGASRLPALPSTIAQLMRDLNDPLTPTPQICQTIEADTTLSAKVLKLANSAFYQRLTATTSIHQAVVRLGHKTVRSLALTVWTQSIRDAHHSGDVGDLLARQLAHGTATAIIARLLLQRRQPDLAEDAYMAGLLHDLGRLALFCQLGEHYAEEVCRRATREQRDLLVLERETLGFDHAMLGARLMDSWHLPAVCIESAARHHEPELHAQTDLVLTAVALADFFATGLGLNIELDAPRINRDPLFQAWVPDDLFIEQCSQAIAEMFGALEGL
jgi:HD-like signal output (HDOD) protein